MGLVPWVCVLVVAVSWSPAQESREYTSAAFASALQMHQPTKSGNVPNLHPQEDTSPNPHPQIRIDPDQLKREGRELMELTQSLQDDIEALNHGLHPKDTTEKLKRIQKLAKHLRGEIAP